MHDNPRHESWGYPQGHTADLSHIRRLIDLALEEDLPSGDVTTDSIGGLSERRKASIVTKEPCRICGVGVLPEIAAKVSSELLLQRSCREGEDLDTQREVVSLSGPLGDILRWERTALNFLQHLSGIATHTRDLVRQAAPVVLLDTRKTLPGYRVLEKYAVRMGGAENHRFSLSDQILIKDNHIDGSGKDAATLVRTAQKSRPAGCLIEVELREPEELPPVLDAAPDIILLDNMDRAQLEQCLEQIAVHPHHPVIEVSGNITACRFQELIELQTEFQVPLRASLGALTYGARRSDLSLRIETGEEHG